MDNQIPPLMTPFLLGRRIDLTLRDYTTKRCVVIGMSFSGERALRVLPEQETTYRNDLAAYFPREGANKNAETFSRSDIRIITVIDRPDTTTEEP